MSTIPLSKFFMQKNNIVASHWLGWLLSGLLIVWINRYTNWDTGLSQIFFDDHSNSFPLKQNELIGLIFHEGIRWVAAMIWIGLVIATIFQKSKQTRFEIVHILIVSLLSAVVVSLLKASSAHSCPWDLAEYGGMANYNRLFEHGVNTTNLGPGKCFPSGHASTAFMWIVLLYSPLAWLTSHRKLIGALLFAMGLLASGVQIMKGAHFLSHVLATAWICWGVALICRELHNIKA